MEIQGLQAECKCNSNLYSLANGQPLKIRENLEIDGGLMFVYKAALDGLD